MIHLDTNYLIGLLVKESPEALDAERWLSSGEPLSASSIVWTEFLNGPVTGLEVTRSKAVIQSRVVEFGEPEAVVAAELFNKTGRRRGSRFDCLIAATAILQKAELATVNEADFRVFVAHGLRLATITSKRSDT